MDIVNTLKLNNPLVHFPSWKKNLNYFYLVIDSNWTGLTQFHTATVFTQLSWL